MRGAWLMLFTGVLLLVGCRADVASPGPDDRWALAVVGDSDSHGYQDSVHFPPSGGLRGGAYHAVSFNWHELVGRLRGEEVDTGVRGIRGTRGRIARVLNAVGIPSRSPRKDDRAYNFAVTGAGCGDLLEGHREVRSLVAMMDADPARWRRGVVVFRIGVKDFGMGSELRALARDPRDPTVVPVIDACIAVIARSVALIHETHPDTRIVLVGIFDNTHWARYFDDGWTGAEHARVATALDRFDSGLGRMAAADPRIAFFDDRAWFHAQFGGEIVEGQAVYHDVSLPGGVRVDNSIGNAPTHATLADGHAGTVWNARWANALLGLVRDTWHLPSTPITDEEIGDLVASSRH